MSFMCKTGGTRKTHRRPDAIFCQKGRGRRALRMERRQGSAAGLPTNTFGRRRGTASRNPVAEKGKDGGYVESYYDSRFFLARLGFRVRCDYTVLQTYA